MSKSWQFSSSRRALSQGVMWVILGLSLVLAAVVNAHRRGALSAKLDRPQVYKGVTVAMPAGWDVTAGRAQEWGRIVEAKNSEGDEDDEMAMLLGRTIRVDRDAFVTDGSPQAYLQRTLSIGQKKKTTQQPVPIAGSPGVLIAMKSRTRLGGGGEFEIPEGMLPATRDVVACAVPPSGRPVLIRYRCLATEESDAHDVDLVRRIAESVKLDDEPPLLRDARDQTVGGVRVTLPDGFAAVDARDPQRSAVVLRSTDDSPAAPWRGITLVPAVLAPKEQMATAINTMLSLQDSSWADASVHDDGPRGTGPIRRWRVDPPDRVASGAGAERAYVLADDHGRALAAIFSGGGSDDAWIDTAWNAIVQKLDLSGAPDPSPMSDAGASLVKSLRGGGDDAGGTTFAKLLADHPPDEQWSLVQFGSPDRTLGWTHLTPGAVGGKHEMRLRIPGRQLEQVTCDWHGKPDLKGYAGTMNYAVAKEPDAFDAPAMTVTVPGRGGGRGRTPDDGTADFEQALTVTTKLDKDRVDLSARPATGASTAVQVPQPANFVPGGWLWTMLGHLPLDDRPIVLRTDVSPDQPSARPTVPLTVVLRAEPLETSTAPASDEKPVTRRVAVEVCGSGAVSRWYFRADGSLDHVDMADHVTRTTRDATEIALEFARVPAMKP